MSTVLYENDANLSILKGKTVCVIGYGSQGHAHAKNLRDSGVTVIIGYPDAGNPVVQKKSATLQAAIADGFDVTDTGAAVGKSDVIVLLAPDEYQPELYATHVVSNLKPGSALVFAHGFNIHYGQIIPPSSVDVVMVAPKGPGHLVRRVFESGGGVPGLAAVHQDATGKAWDVALAYAKGIGCTRGGVLKTTFMEETETDLFGEQTVLCGGLTALMTAGFETLVEAGYQPEIAYFECVHEMKLIVDLIYEGGLANMRHSISNTAEYGDFSVGPFIVDESVKSRMKVALNRIQSGEFARNFILESKANRPMMHALRRKFASHLLEKTGEKLRGMMTWLGKKVG